MTEQTLASSASPEVPAHYPPVLYVPCAEHVTHAMHARPFMQRTKEGQLALLVYSALDRLQEGCGVQQPWVLVPAQALNEIQRTQGVDLVLLDIMVPVEHRHSEGQAL